MCMLSLPDAAASSSRRQLRRILHVDPTVREFVARHIDASQPRFAGVDIHCARWTVLSANNHAYYVCRFECELHGDMSP